MGRYVGNKWVESLPSNGPQDQVQGNNEPVSAPSGGGGGGSAPAPSGGAGQYNTVNGLQTVASMGQQLKAAGWQGDTNDANAVAAAYASTTKGQVTPSGTSGGGGPSGGGGTQQNAVGNNPGDSVQALLNALAGGNKAAADEAAKEFAQTFGLDEKKFQESVDEYQKNFGLAQAGVTGTYNGQQTEAAREFNETALQNAAKIVASAQNDPFRQLQVEYGLSGIGGLNGQANALPKFGAVSGSAQGTGVLGMATQDMNNLQSGQVGKAFTSTPNAVPNQQFFASSQVNQLPGQPATPVQWVNPAAVGGVKNLPGFGGQPPQQWNGPAPSTASTLGTAFQQPQASVAQAQNNPGSMQPNGILGQFRTPTDVIARNYVTADKPTQDMITSAISQNTGLDQATVDQQIKSQLPQQAGPQFGLAQL